MRVYLQPQVCADIIHGSFRTYEPIAIRAAHGQLIRYAHNEYTPTRNSVKDKCSLGAMLVLLYMHGRLNTVDTGFGYTSR